MGNFKLKAYMPESRDVCFSSTPSGNNGIAFCDDISSY